AHQNQGVGRSLKLAQREVAIGDGIDCIEWTYDPMRARNAFFNIERLGAIARRYLPDYYGAIQSRLQQGLPSDRLVAEWWLKSARVKHARAGKSPRQTRAGPVAEVSIPADFGALMEADPEQGRDLQGAVRQKLQQCFRRKLAITGFAIEGDRGRYRLEPLAAVGPRGRIA
ncbi:MAG TPA: acetyltransferase, partial [Terriglobia bacterium]|nr:acetyltransferase [Terriglobia bacterium]